MTFEPCRHELWDIGSPQVTNDISAIDENIIGNNNISPSIIGSSFGSNQNNTGTNVDGKVAAV